jgi:heme/copper-type cytochrome/quinol oxidase subunit 3
MILFGLLIIIPENKNKDIKPSQITWGLTILGSVIIFTSFIYDYTGLMISEGYFTKGGPSLLDPGFIDAITSYIPEKFKWWIFITGEVLIFAAIGKMFYRLKNKTS